MRLTISAFLAATVLSSTAGAQAQTLQQQINALPQSGGVVDLMKNGCPYRAPDSKVVQIRSNVAIVGAGPCTVIPPIANATGGRIHNVRIENLLIDVALIPGTARHYGVDFRDASTSVVRNVLITDSSTSNHNRLWVGVLLYSTPTGGCFYNTLDHISADAGGAGSAGVEIYNGANQNVIVGGVLSGESGVKIINSNGTSIVGTSLEERSYKEMVWCRNWVGEVIGTTLQGVRCETATYGPVWYTGCIGGSGYCLPP